MAITTYAELQTAIAQLARALPIYRSHPRFHHAVRGGANRRLRVRQMETRPASRRRHGAATLAGRLSRLAARDLGGIDAGSSSPTCSRPSCRRPIRRRRPAPRASSPSRARRSRSGRWTTRRSSSSTTRRSPRSPGSDQLAAHARIPTSTCSARSSRRQMFGVDPEQGRALEGAPRRAVRGDRAAEQQDRGAGRHPASSGRRRRCRSCPFPNTGPTCRTTKAPPPAPSSMCCRAATATGRSPTSPSSPTRCRPPAAASSSPARPTARSRCSPAPRPSSTGSTIPTSAGPTCRRRAAAYSALPSTDQWQFAQFGNFVIAVQTNTAPQVFDLADRRAQFADLGGCPPQARYIVGRVGRFLVLSGLARRSLSHPMVGAQRHHHLDVRHQPERFPGLPRRRHRARRRRRRDRRSCSRTAPSAA